MITLLVEKREVLGNKVAQLRTQGFVVGELYGQGAENVHVQIKKDDFKNVYKEAGESTLVTVMLGKESIPVLIHSVAWDPITDQVLNVDLLRVNMNEAITVPVAIHYTGESPAVTDWGGVLVKALEEIEVEALPANLPHAIEVDLSVLKELHQSILIKDVVLPKGVIAIGDEDTVVAAVVEQEKEEEVVATSTEAVEGAPVAAASASAPEEKK